MKKSDYIEKKKNDPPYTNKATLTVYLVLRALVIFVLVRAALRRDFESVFFCGMTLVLMILPSFFSRKLNVELPTTLEVIILLFIFAAEILGELNSFYIRALAYLSYDTVAPRRVTAVFLMGMMSLLGFRPQVGRCAQCGTPIALDGRADDDYAAYFGAQAGGVLCEHCGAGGGVRLTAGEVRYLQAIMRRGLETLSEAGECSDALFGALRQMAQERLGVQIRSEKLL